MPQARAALDPFHVVRLAGEALNQCRRRVQQELHGRPGQADDPLYKAHRTLHTGNDLLTPSQHKRLEALFANDDHTPVEVTWSVYQKMITAYRQPKRAKGKRLMQEPITAISHGVPAALREDITLGRTLKKRAGDILVYFNHPHTSNGPTEALNGHLEHLHGSALGFHNLTNYITRTLLETGGFKPQLPP
jgi:transposase family protein